MKIALTENKLSELARRATKSCTLTEGSGMQIDLRMGKNGCSVHFRAKFNLDGKRYHFTLGKWPRVTLSLARKKYADLADKFAHGIVPVEEAEPPKEAPHVPTFREIWQAVYNRDAPTLKVDTMHTRKLMFRRWFEPYADRPITDYTPSWVLQTFIQPAVDRGLTSSISKIARTVTMTMDYAVALGVIQFNPCSKISKLLPKFKGGHYKAFGEDTLEKDIHMLFHNLEQFCGEKAVATVALYFFTLLRAAEAPRLRFDAITPDHGCIVQTKTRDAFKVALSPQAMKLIAAMQTMHPDTPFVIEARGMQGTAGMARKYILRSGMADKFTLHGVRTCGRMWMQTCPAIKESIAELCLSHNPPGGMVQQAYNRGDYFSERMEAMTLWGDFVEKAIGEPLVRLYQKYICDENVA